MDDWDNAVKEVNVANWLADNHFPAAETCDVAQPIEATGRPVTFWRSIHGRPGDSRDVAILGTVLRCPSDAARRSPTRNFATHLT
jgi:hypothetical protein